MPSVLRRGAVKLAKSPRCLIYAYKFELPSESGMAIQILSDCHAVATRGMDVYL